MTLSAIDIDLSASRAVACLMCGHGLIPGGMPEDLFRSI